MHRSTHLRARTTARLAPSHRSQAPALYPPPPQAETAEDKGPSPATDDEKRRAPRFDMALTVQYRRRGGARWVAGSTRNVSRSGALVHPTARTTLPAGTVDFVLSLPPCGIVRTARIRGTGRVVRVSRGRTPAFALTIVRYRFLKPGEGLPRLGLDV